MSKEPKKIRRFRSELEQTSEKPDERQKVVADIQAYLENRDAPEDAKQMARELFKEHNIQEAAPAPAAARSRGGREDDRHGGYGRGGRPTRTREGDPSALGLPFHNPYNFVPFAKGAPVRDKPTPRTADELADERDRFTGILELEVTTVTPLLSSAADPDVRNDHKVFQALTVGPDVIVPATSIRGFLRGLLGLLRSDPLTHLDEWLYLCNDRDINLGPTQTDKDRRAFLAKVVRPGSPTSAGEIELGETELRPFDELEAAARQSGIRLRRPDSNGNQPGYWAALGTEGVSKVSESESTGCPWQVKLSGRPIKPKGKREGFFRSGGVRVTLPPRYWAEYASRHRHAVRPALKKGDLVWLEPRDEHAAAIRGADDIASLQWARWGRRGTPIGKAVRPEFHPDATRNDGLVSMTTDLFGQAPTGDNKGVPNFAGRVRPENLVFRDAAASLGEPVPLAVMGQPHPGCYAFYRSQQDGKMNGYKVYRAADPAAAEKPWLFKTQGVYNEDGRLDSNHRQKINISAQLLPESRAGTLRLAVRALSEDELANVLMLCHVPWRIGGGKPLGLGSCAVRLVRMLDETGAEVPVPEGWMDRLAPLVERIALWEDSQRPVSKLRYPRAASKNRNKVQRGGHVWFNRMAMPKKGGSNQKIEPGRLQAVRLSGELAEAAGTHAVSGQSLPAMAKGNADADLLYGYDIFIPQTPEGRAAKEIPESVAFDPDVHAGKDNVSGGNTSQNRESRERRKKDRGTGGGGRRDGR